MQRQVVIVHSHEPTRQTLARWASRLGWQPHVSDGHSIPDIVPTGVVVILLDTNLRVPAEGWLLRFRDRYRTSRPIVKSIGASGAVAAYGCDLPGLRLELPTDETSFQRMLSDDGAVSSPMSGAESMLVDTPGRAREEALGMHAPPTLNIDVLGTPDQHMQELADQLRGGWNIQRIRIYRVEPLFDGAMTSGSHLNVPHVLIPVWQHGHGFKAGKDWYEDEFVIPHDRFRELFSVPHEPVTADVSDRDPDSSLGCTTIAWGDAANRTMIPLIARDGMPVGLLAIDRRGARASTEITPGDIASLEAAGLDKVLSILAEDISLQAKEALSAWERELTDILSVASREFGGRKGLKVALRLIVQRWGEGKRLAGMYVVREHNNELLEAWAGTGAVWEARSAKRHLFKAVAPYDSALHSPAVIQDVKSWLKTKEGDKKELRTLTKEFGPHLDALWALGGWLAIPLPKGEPGRAILVIDSVGRYYFTESRVKMFDAMAARLAPLFLWALAEAQHDWIPLSLSHTFIPNERRLNDLLVQIPNDARAYLDRLFKFQRMVFSSLKLLTPDARAYEHPSTNVLQIIDDVVELLKDEERPIEVAIDGATPAVAMTPEIVEIALFNLVENAVRYSVPGSPIRIQVSNDAHRLALAILNRVEVPISLSEQKRIFGLFERVARSEPATGTGIGLALISRFCDLTEMKCTLIDRGEHTRVVCFRLELPLAEARQAEVDAVEPTPPGRVATHGAPPSSRRTVDRVEDSPAEASLNRARALYYVDDDLDFVQTLHSKLSFIPGATLYKYLHRDAVARFMADQTVDVYHAWFLLDIMMQVPDVLKKAPHVWPRDYKGDSRVCGIALCAWLISERNVARSRIALLTRRTPDQRLHEAALNELSLPLNGSGPAYIRKDAFAELDHWLHGVDVR